MSRLALLTEELKRKGKKAFIPFFTAFYPSENKFAELLLIAEDSGADIVEIGIPFSDPIADGRLIQHSSEWSLKNGFRISRFVSLMKELRKELKIPVVIMSYLNPIFRFGIEKFASFMWEQGIEGIIFPDLPVEERKILDSSFKSRGIGVVNMVAPSTGEDRMRIICKESDGFVYLITVYGVTGMRGEVDAHLEKTASKLRSITDKPVYAGFGISNPAQASMIKEYVDGIIVGSAIVKIMMGREKDFSTKEIEIFLKEMRGAI